MLDGRESVLMPFRPGEIYLAFGGDDKYRPVLIVSREEFNRGKYVVAVPFTSAQFDERSSRSNCVAFRAGEFGLDKNCVAQAEAISVYHKDDLDLDKGAIAVVDDEKMREITLAIGYIIAAHCEPE
jgi:mRNA-degrading endonuclease toxin of MazEF toxin-antitoxin module